MNEAQLQQLITTYHVPLHIQKHMQKVTEVAVFIGEKINHRHSGKVDLELLRQSALLHDVLKLCDFKSLDIEHFQQTITAEDIQFWTALMKSCSQIGHCEAAYNMLKDLGEDKLAVIIRKHSTETIITVEGELKTWEEKILYYADKRVKHDKVVSLKERLADLRKRYNREKNPHPEEPLIEKAIYKLEKELCREAGIKQEEIR